MKKKEVENFVKRYDKFKKCNMPTPFFDDERQTLEYVYFDDDNLIVNSSLEYSLGNIILDNLYYPFTTKMIVIEDKDGKFIEREEIGHSHAHSFEEVIRSIYNSPSSFSISKEEETFYSEQELKFIKHIKSYLTFIEFEDGNFYKKSKARYVNKRQKKYGKAYTMRLSDDDIKSLIEKGYVDCKYSLKYSKEKKYNKGEMRFLIIDKNDIYKYYVEMTKIEIDENKKIERRYYKVLEKFN